MEVLKIIIPAIVTIVTALITGVLIPYIRMKMKKENYEFLKSIVKSAVDAAEQKFKGSGRGKEKRAEVIKWIKLRYPKIDENLLDVLIDEMVLGLNKIGKEIDK